MAAAISIGNEMSPSKVPFKSYQPQTNMKDGVDLLIQNSLQNQSSRNVPTGGKLATTDNGPHDNISKVSKRNLSGGRFPALELSGNQDKSFLEASKKKNSFEEFDINQKKNSQSQNSEILEVQDNSNIY